MPAAPNSGAVPGAVPGPDSGAYSGAVSDRKETHRKRCYLPNGEEIACRGGVDHSDDPTGFVNPDPEGRYVPDDSYGPDDPNYESRVNASNKRDEEIKITQEQTNMSLKSRIIPRIMEFKEQFKEQYPHYKKLQLNDKLTNKKLYVGRVLGNYGEIEINGGHCRKISEDKKTCEFEFDKIGDNKTISLRPVKNQNGDEIPKDDVWVKKTFSMGRSADEFRDPTFEGWKHRKDFNKNKQDNRQTIRRGGKKSRKSRKKNNRRKTKKYKNHKNHKKTRRKSV